MIAGVRQFKLINALGREYDMTRPDALLYAPDGLGWGTERTVNRLGMTYIAINEKEIHQSPSGEMVFRTYEEYGRFLSFCQQGGLVLCYKPLDTWYYCEALISIQKSEIQWENNHLICPVQFTLLSYWYEKVVAQTAEPPEPVEPSYRTVTGDPAVFNARYSYPIRDLSVAIQGSQELNGYDKPWVGGAGKNIAPPLSEWEMGYYSSSGIKTATQSAPRGEKLLDSFIKVSPNTTYTFTAEFPENFSGEKWWSVCQYTSNDASTLLNRPARLNEDSFTFTTGSEVNYIRPSFRACDVATNVQIEQGSTATEYEPYENICPITSYTSVTITQTGSQTNTYEVELTGAGNVYKGTLDVTSGELVVTHISMPIPSNVGWVKSSAFPGGFYYQTGTNNYMPFKKDTPLSACTHREIANALTEYEVGTVYVDGSVNIRLMPPTATVQDWKDYIDAQETRGTPITIAGELAAPLTYTLTPTQLNNLIGQNTIQADAGEVTVTYRTDARTEYKVYPYQYSYTYGDTAQNVFDISCDLPSYFKLTIFGEATNPTYRVVVNGSVVKSGKINATIGSSQKLVINTDPKNTEIALYTLSNTRINNLYGYSDFATERIFALPQGECQVQVLTEDEQPPKVMIEVLKHV